MLTKILNFFVLVSVQAVLFMSAAIAESPVIPSGSAPAVAPGMPPQQPGLMGMLLPFVAMFGVVYFLMIRPQQKKMKEQQAMLGALQVGDEVITAAGMIGTITGLTDKVATLEIASNVKIKVLRSHVGQVVKGPLKDNL